CRHVDRHHRRATLVAFARAFERRPHRVRARYLVRGPRLRALVRPWHQLARRAQAGLPPNRNLWLRRTRRQTRDRHSRYRGRTAPIGLLPVALSRLAAGKNENGCATAAWASSALVTACHEVPGLMVPSSPPCGPIIHVRDLEIPAAAYA